MPRIEVRGLTKRFGEVIAVDRLSFTAEAGTVVGFLGPNGAGKPNIGNWRLFARLDLASIAARQLCYAIEVGFY